MNRRCSSPIRAASSGSSRSFRIASGERDRIILGNAHDVLPRLQVEAREVVLPHDRDHRNARGHHFEARGAQPEVVEVVTLDVGGGDVLRDVVLGYLADRDDVVADVQLVGELQERVVEDVADDDHDDVGRGARREGGAHGSAGGGLV